LRQPVQLAPGVRRLLAPNPGMMTGAGTNTYLLGEHDVAVIDPGPAIDRHIDAILAAAGRIRTVLVTHTHADHSPAALKLSQLTGAKVLGRPAPEGQHQDATFSADRILHDGDTVAVDELDLRVLHTPGHASNHLCYLLTSERLLFTGDHIINGSTVVIDPPDGDMSAYLASLERLKGLRLSAIAPGHGELIDEPYAAIDWLIAHRLQRERGVVAALRSHPGRTATELVPRVYMEIDAGLYPLAERSLLAHLYKLERDGRARLADQRWELCGGR
jgi:glyoxylase-like metal-dependent hydrolase (beta-lactamase superfamily II)